MSEDSVTYGMIQWTCRSCWIKYFWCKRCSVKLFFLSFFPSFCVYKPIIAVIIKREPVTMVFNYPNEFPFSSKSTVPDERDRGSADPQRSLPRSLSQRINEDSYPWTSVAKATRWPLRGGITEWDPHEFLECNHASPRSLDAYERNLARKRKRRKKEKKHGEREEEKKGREGYEDDEKCEPTSW